MNFKKGFKFVLLVFVVLLALEAGKLLWWIYSPGVVIENVKNNYINIPTGSEYEDVRKMIVDRGLVRNIKAFDWVADKKNYSNFIMPGHYEFEDGLNNNDLINLLRSGSQIPVSLIFNNIRSLEGLSGIVAGQIEADSSEIIDLLLDETYISQFKFTHETIIGAFIPNTYEFYWNTSASGFVERMIDEYEKFWNKERKDKAASKNMTIKQVSILASIVDRETVKKTEKSTIAGVYLNRLERGIRLQADPTIKFAIGDFSRKRILKSDLNVNSPYNTYRHAGLPPGPISIPSISGIDAVLNAEDHSFLYFCARADMSGYHHFSKSLREHNRYAQKYRQALNKLKIMN
ncbi:MAG: endolytic transglycosylase MltG [Bacteroidetes bacterium]|nr:endolytic transglycosylase MltG [Bacteroidota bacterium]